MAEPGSQGWKEPHSWHSPLGRRETGWGPGSRPDSGSLAWPTPQAGGSSETGPGPQAGDEVSLRPRPTQQAAVLTGTPSQPQLAGGESAGAVHCSAQ